MRFANVGDGMDLLLDDLPNILDVIDVKLDQHIVLAADAEGFRETLDLGDAIRHIGHMAQVSFDEDEDRAHAASLRQIPQEAFGFAEGPSRQENDQE